MNVVGLTFFASWSLKLCLILAALRQRATSSIGMRREEVVAGFLGDDVVLSCKVDVATCGPVYFITWTKNISGDWQCVYLYSGLFESSIGNVTEPERITFNLKNDSAQLWIHSLKLKDEGVYKCDVTYVRGQCPSLSFTNLLTLVTPGEPRIRVNGQEVRNGSRIGPFQEGALVVLECKSVGGRPQPEVRWKNGSHPLRGKTTVSTDGGDTTTVITSLRFLLSRWDLGAVLECHTENSATSVPLMAWFEFEIYVRPMSLTIRSPQDPVVAGEMVSLTCMVEGARPASIITWYNRSSEVNPQPVTNSDLTSSGTFRTTSTLVFIASRYDHQVEFVCRGTNQVMEDKKEAPLIESTQLEVLYPPAVHVEPSGRLAINESESVTIKCRFDANPPEVTDFMWYKDGTALTENGIRRLETESYPVPSLVFHAVSRTDSGSYSCHLKNAFGRGNSTNFLYLDVLYAPTVQIQMSPSVVEESSGTVVSLTCDVIDGNPRQLSVVKWFQNGELINTSHVVNLTLHHVNRTHAANYSCQGHNAANWSIASLQQELVVKYRPGRAAVLQLEEVAKKGKPIVLYCHLDNLGNPPATSYQWSFQEYLLASNTSQLLIPSVTVSNQGLYSCAGVNEIGTGDIGVLELKAKAPPHFLQRLPEQGGALKNSSSVSLSCRVECQPLCEIEWSRNNVSLKNSKFFQTKSFLQPPDPVHNLFSSITSVLSWNMSLLPPSGIDFNNFTCASTGNELGPGVNSTIIFRVEYPPEKVSVSDLQVEVVEGEIPPAIVCSALAYPEGNYVWAYGQDIVSRGPVLFFNSSISRQDSGNYTCVVSNRHGKGAVQTVVTVLYVPECRIHEEYLTEGQPILTCEADARPPVQNFTWFLDNVTVSEVTVKSESAKSRLRVSSTNIETHRAYSCVARNAVGQSEPCRLQITYVPSPSGWAQLLFQEGNLLTAVAVIGGAVFSVFLLVFVATILIIRKAHFHKNAKRIEIVEGRNGARKDGEQEEGVSNCTSPLLSLTTISIENSLFVETKLVGTKPTGLNRFSITDHYFVKPEAEKLSPDSSS